MEIIQKKFFILFIVLTILISHTKCQTKEDCESSKPLTVYDCSKKSTAENSCCFTNKAGTRQCKWWDSKLTTTVVLNSGETVYQCDNYRGVPCGANISIDSKMCHKSSFITNTCCYFFDEKGNTGRCMWWGEGYRGQNKYRNNINVECSSFNISILNNYCLVLLILCSFIF